MNRHHLQELAVEQGRGIDKLFYPQSIAVIGASQNALKPNGIPLYLMSMFDYRGDLYPVNPKYDRVGGLKCYDSVHDIKEPIDLALIGVAASETMEVLKECAEKKVKGAIVLTSGFAEVSEEGRSVQREMKNLAEKSGMRILGPNCLGVLNYYNGNMASFFYNQKRTDLVHPNTLSFITQSGGLGGIIYQMISQMSIGFNYFASTGNEADISFAEVLYYFSRRKEVSIIAGYLEGLQRDGRLFMTACRRALKEHKPVTLLKAGQTAGGASAAASHTGAMVGDDRVYDSVFKQLGVIRADDIDQMNALVAIYASGRLPAGKKMAIITISGGGGVIVADRCPRYGLEVVPLAENTQRDLKEFFPSFGSVSNPVDLTSQLFFDRHLFEKALHLVLQDPGIDVAGFFYTFEMPDAEASEKIIRAYRESSKPLIIFTWPTGQDYAVEAKNKLIQAGVPVIEHIPSGLWAISALADWAKKSADARSGESYAVEPTGGSRSKISRAAGLLEVKEASGTFSCTEWRSKLLLSSYKIPVTVEKVAVTVDEAVATAEKIGYPVAMKIMAPDILHKSDAGGVFLNVSGSEKVRDVYDQLLKNARSYNPEAHIEGVLVQEMLRPGLELILGVKKDPVFGPVIAVGLGGIHVEIYDDLATRVAPLSKKEAFAMLAELKGKALLNGYRDLAPRDTGALVDTLVKVSEMALELEGFLVELDINPLVVYEKDSGILACDALAVVNSSCF